MNLINNLFEGAEGSWSGGVAHILIIISIVIALGRILGKTKICGILPRIKLTYDANAALSTVSPAPPSSPSPTGDLIRDLLETKFRPSAEATSGAKRRNIIL